MVQYRKYALLMIDEWLLYPLKETEARDLLEIVESRYKRNSTIFCSQFDIPGWPVPQLSAVVSNGNVTLQFPSTGPADVTNIPYSA